MPSLMLPMRCYLPMPLDCSGPMAAALGYFESALGLVCPPRKDAGSFLQARKGLAGCKNGLGGLPWAAALGCVWQGWVATVLQASSVHPC